MEMTQDRNRQGEEKQYNIMIIMLNRGITKEWWNAL